MALLGLGGGLGVISGKIGNWIFSHNKGGAYIRSRGFPVNPNTDLQVVVKAAMAFLTARWSQTLTAGQRTAWNLYASSVSMTNRIGDAVFHSGFNHYIRSNMIRKQIGDPIIDDGPVIFEIPAQDPTFAITASEATQDISFAFDITMDWAVENGSLLYLFEGSPQNPQINFFNGPWRSADRVGGADPGPVVSPSDQPSQFGIAELQHIWGYARISRADGRLSEPFRADTFCAA